MGVKWTKPKYPGDAVRIVYLTQNENIGDVRIQHYGVGKYKVAAFVPGHSFCYPGDTPKVEPEIYEWYENVTAVNNAFDRILAGVIKNGWTERMPAKRYRPLAIVRQDARRAARAARRG